MSIADELEAQAAILLARAQRERENERELPAPPEPLRPTFYTVPQMAARHDFLTEGMLRRHLFHRTTNGLLACGAVAKIGARVLIDEAAFLNWLRACAQAERKSA